MGGCIRTPPDKEEEEGEVHATEKPLAPAPAPAKKDAKLAQGRATSVWPGASAGASPASARQWLALA